MPRVLDRARRQRELGAAAWGLVAEGGVEWLTLRRLVDTAGLSLGGLRRTVPNTHALRRLLADELQSRTRDHYKWVLAQRDPENRARVLLSTDDVTRARARIEVQMRHYRVYDEGAGRWERPYDVVTRECAERLRDVCADCLGVVPSSESANARIAGLASAADGLMAGLLVSADLSVDADRAVRTFLALSSALRPREREA